MSLPPIPHPDVRQDARPGPLLVRFDWNGDAEEGALSLGTQQLFGPFASVWLWADTIMARALEGTEEYELGTYRVSEQHGGGVWHAADDLYYTDVVFLHATKAEPTLDAQLLGSLIVEDVKRHLKGV